MFKSKVSILFSVVASATVISNFNQTAQAQEADAAATPARRGFHSTGVVSDAQVEQRSMPLQCDDAEDLLKVGAGSALALYGLGAAGEIKHELGVAGAEAERIVAELANLKPGDPAFLEKARKLDELLGGNNGRIADQAAYAGESAAALEKARAMRAAALDNLAAMLRTEVHFEGEANIRQLLARMSEALGQPVTEEQLAKMAGAVDAGATKMRPFGIFEAMKKAGLDADGRIEALIKEFRPEKLRGEITQLRRKVSSLRNGVNPDGPAGKFVGNATMDARGEMTARFEKASVALEAKEARLKLYQAQLEAQQARAAAARGVMDHLKLALGENAALYQKHLDALPALERAEFLALNNSLAAQEVLDGAVASSRSLATHKLKLTLAYQAMKATPSWLQTAKAAVLEKLEYPRRLAGSFRFVSGAGLLGICAYEGVQLSRDPYKLSDSQIAAAPASFFSTPNGAAAGNGPSAPVEEVQAFEPEVMQLFPADGLVPAEAESAKDYVTRPKDE